MGMGGRRMRCPNCGEDVHTINGYCEKCGDAIGYKCFKQDRR